MLYCHMVQTLLSVFALAHRLLVRLDRAGEVRKQFSPGAFASRAAAAVQLFGRFSAVCIWLPHVCKHITGDHHRTVSTMTLCAVNRILHVHHGWLS